MNHDDILSSLLTEQGPDRVRYLYDLLVSTSESDYTPIAKQLAPTDTENLLEFLLYVLRGDRFRVLDGVDDTVNTVDEVNRLSRRLMSSLLSATPVMTLPDSLFLSDLTIDDGSMAEMSVLSFNAEHQGKPVLLKPLHRTRRNLARDLGRETLLWRSLPDHQFVLKFLGIYEHEAASELFLVVPYMCNDTLAQWRKRMGRTLIDYYLLEVAEGLNFIHSQGVVHGDLCGANVLLDVNYRAKIAYFGLTRYSEAAVTGYGALHENFAAPELFGCYEDDDSDSDPTPTQESDVYAFGCLCYEIYYDTVPFEGGEYAQIMRAVIRGERPERWPDLPMSDEVWNLISTCWLEDKQQRPTLEHIIETMASSTQPGPVRPMFSPSLDFEVQSGFSEKLLSSELFKPWNFFSARTSAATIRSQRVNPGEFTPLFLDRDPTVSPARRQIHTLENFITTFLQGSDLGGPIPARWSETQQLPLHQLKQPTPLPDLTSLLALLRIRPTTSIGPKANQSTVDLMCRLLALPDYDTIVSTLRDTLEVELLLDFILYLLNNRCLPTQTSPELYRQARRLMFTLLARMPITPASLFIRGVTAELSLRNFIGMGGFGYVYKGEYKRQQVALKVIYKNIDRKDFCREALVWRSLSHPYILPLLGIPEVEPQLCLVSPYMRNGTLAAWRGDKQPGINEVRTRILEVAEGVRYIHSEGIVHGDLRGANILLDASFHSQIADFGLTRHSDVATTRSTTPLTLRFAAPELLGMCNTCNQDECDCSGEDDPPKSQNTHQTDVYAFGCLYYEVYFDTMPFAKVNDYAVMRQIISGKRPQRLGEPHMEDAEWDLVQLCWGPDATARPKMEVVIDKMKLIGQAALVPSALSTH